VVHLSGDDPELAASERPWLALALRRFLPPARALALGEIGVVRML
jgi:hypothetical protein